MPKFSVVLAAAGNSSRFRDANYKKPFAILCGKAVWLHSADRFLKRGDVKQLIVVVAQSEHDSFMSKFGANVAVLGIDVVVGGQERSDSIANALQQVKGDLDFVAIHDAARPCVPDDDIQAVFSAAAQSDAAILACPITSTLKRSADGKSIDETIDRSHLWQAMTPQVFRREKILSAFQNMGPLNPTDEAQLFELLGKPVTIVPGSPLNIKITTKQDMLLAAACLNALPKSKFDAPIHPFAGDTLWR